MTLLPRKLTTFVVRMVLTLLLAFAASSPALAEFVHLEDTVAHLRGSSALEVSVSSGAEGEERESGSADKVAHCAFGHCAHAAAELSSSRTPAPLETGPLPYFPEAPGAMPAVEASGLDDPPRA